MKCCNNPETWLRCLHIGKNAVSSPGASLKAQHDARTTLQCLHPQYYSLPLHLTAFILSFSRGKPTAVLCTFCIFIVALH